MLRMLRAAAGQPGDYPTPLITDEESTALRATLTDPREWVCAEHRGRPAKTCHFLLRAKRVNAYPDGVELVFREGGERELTREFAVETLDRYASRLQRGRAPAMCDSPAHGAKLRMAFANKVQLGTYD
jgi:hypothetical protein